MRAGWECNMPGIAPGIRTKIAVFPLPFPAPSLTLSFHDEKRREAQRVLEWRADSDSAKTAATLFATHLLRITAFGSAQGTWKTGPADGLGGEENRGVRPKILAPSSAYRARRPWR